MPVAVVRDSVFRDHDPGPYHPECPARLASIEHALEGMQVKLQDVAPRPASEAEIARVHSERHIQRLMAARGQSASLDADTSTSPGSVEAALLAAGGTIELMARVARGEGPPGLALVRPPGHHATRDTSMGFCLINNIAVAAAALRADGLAERIAIYDWDVHHGNGTEAIFYDDPDVLYLSTHQWPFYPGTGAGDAIGRGKGEGATLNVPLAAGTDDAVFLQATDDVFARKVRDFQPDMILISAGFDPFVNDPLGGFRVTVDGFAQLARRWRDLAEELCDGRIAGVLEGGYDLDGLGACVRAVLEVWDA